MTNLPLTTTASAPAGVLPLSIPQVPLLSEEQERQITTWQRHVGLLELAAPYEPKDDSDAEQKLAGLTNLQVMWKRSVAMATGKLGKYGKPERWAVEFVQEHTVGKAMQRVQSTQVTMTYQDLLGSYREAEDRFQATVVEVQPVNEQPPESLDWSHLI